jgi:hypothetical protein
MANPVAQIFISYAHLDNTKPQGYEMGWVDRLYNALEIELPTHGVEVHWWRDGRDLNPESYFDETILEAVSNSDAFLAVLSPAYPQRPFCIKELNHFLNDSMHGSVDQQRRRVLKVVKRPIVDPQISRILPEHIGGSGEFLFYTIDRQTKKVLLFVRPTGEIARPEFWDAIDELAAAVARTANQIKPRPKVSQPGIAVYVAEPGEDQDQSYRTIRSELMSKGFQVLPSRRIPDDYQDALPFIDDQLAHCIISIHLLGERSGYIPFVPPGKLAKPITRLQLDQAEARCHADRMFRRFIWARQSLKPTQADQRNLIAGFESGTALLPTDEFVTEPLEQFKNVVLDHLRRRVLLSTPRKPSRRYPILLIGHPTDQPVLDELAASLHKADCEILPASLDTIGPEDEARVARLAAQVDTAIVFVTAAHETWAQTVLGKLYTVSIARDDGRPGVRALLSRSGSGNVADCFHSQYCNLVLNAEAESWESAVRDLCAHIERATQP